MDLHRLSMLSFGFTIYKFLLYVKESLSASGCSGRGFEQTVFLLFVFLAAMLPSRNSAIDINVAKPIERGH
jgi:hypothetical protein